jgi:hypothetical protein
MPSVERNKTGGPRRCVSVAQRVIRPGCLSLRLMHSKNLSRACRVCPFAPQMPPKPPFSSLRKCWKRGVIGICSPSGLAWQTGSRSLGLILTDGRAALAAILTARPRVRHQSSWGTRCGKFRRTHRSSITTTKVGAKPSIGPMAELSPKAAFVLSGRFGRGVPLARTAPRARLGRCCCLSPFPRLSGRQLPPWRCCFEARRRIRPMVCFVSVESVDRVVYSIFQRFNLDGETRARKLFIPAP